MRQIFVGGKRADSSTYWSNTATRYFAINEQDSMGGVGAINISGQRTLIGAAGTVRNFHIRLTTAPGSGKSWTFYVYKESSATALTVTIADTATSGSIEGTDVAFGATERIVIRSIPSGSPAYPGTISWSLEFQPDDSSVYVFSSGSFNNLNNTGAREYGTLTHSNFTSSAVSAEGLIPHAATVTGLAVRLTASPGTGKNYVFSIYKNGAEEVTSQVTLQNANVTGSITGLSIAVNAGDTLCVSYVASGSPNASIATWAVIMDPDTSDEFALTGRCEITDQSNATYASLGNYQTIVSDGNSGYRKQLVEHAHTELTFKKLFIKATTAPGSSNDYTFTVDSEAGVSTLTATITGAGTTEFDTTHTFTTSSATFDSIWLKIAPSSTPTAAGVTKVALVGIVSGASSPSASPSPTPSSSVSLSASSSASLSPSLSLSSSASSSQSPSSSISLSPSSSASPSSSISLSPSSSASPSSSVSSSPSPSQSVSASVSKSPSSSQSPSASASSSDSASISSSQSPSSSSSASVSRSPSPSPSASPSPVAWTNDTKASTSWTNDSKSQL